MTRVVYNLYDSANKEFDFDFDFDFDFVKNIFLSSHNLSRPILGHKLHDKDGMHWKAEIITFPMHTMLTL